MKPEIPGDILKNLCCDVCHKFLSVQPVKVFPENIVKCGRCCEGKDEGVLSLYGMIANLYRFPCVNRYDGCQKLLEPSQVAAHEKHCKSKLHACPQCWDNEQVPTHLMIKHYKEKHEANLLETPDFSIKAKEPLSSEQFFLYELENKLFLIECHSYGDMVTLNASCLGDCSEEEEITQKFILYCGSSRISTEEMLCLPRSETGKRVRVHNLTSVCFQIKIYKTSSEMSVAEQVKGESMAISLQAPSLSCQPSESLVSSPEIRKSAALIVGNFREDELMKPRVIFLNSSLRKMNKLSVDSASGYCVHNHSKRKIHFKCFCCAELKYSISLCDGYRYVNVVADKEKAYIDCEVCNKLASKFHLLKSRTVMKFMELNLFRQIQFFCIWDCKERMSLEDILKHEFACEKQPVRLCPVDWCLMKGKLFEIKKHFEEHSPEYALSFDSDIIVDLDPSKPPMKQFLLVRNAFVCVELTWIKRKWQMKFVLCGEKDTFAGRKLGTMAFDYYNSNDFLGSAEQPQCFEFTHIEAVRIKCMLIDR